MRTEIVIIKVHVIRFNDPAEAAQLRKGEKTYNLSRLSLLSWSTPDLAVSMENLQSWVHILNYSVLELYRESFRTLDDDKTEIEIQRLNFEKEKEQFEKEQEAFEKRQEAFEKRRRTLELAQAKLEAEKVSVQKEHAEQVYIFLIYYLKMTSNFYFSIDPPITRRLAKSDRTTEAAWVRIAGEGKGTSFKTRGTRKRKTEGYGWS